MHTGKTFTNLYGISNISLWLDLRNHLPSNSVLLSHVSRVGVVYYQTI